MVTPLCISSQSVSTSTEERRGAAIWRAVEVGGAVEGRGEGGRVLILSCVVRVASLRR